MKVIKAGELYVKKHLIGQVMVLVFGKMTYEGEVIDVTGAGGDQSEISIVMELRSCRCSTAPGVVHNFKGWSQRFLLSIESDVWVNEGVITLPPANGYDAGYIFPLPTNGGN